MYIFAFTHMQPILVCGIRKKLGMHCGGSGGDLKKIQYSDEILLL